MNRIDSIKFKVPNSCVKKFSFDKANTKQIYFNRENKQTGQQAVITKCQNRGLKSVTFNQHSDYSVIEASAKILGDKYYNLISGETFPDFIDAINESGEIELKGTLTFCDAEILKVDVTTNVQMESYQQVKDTVRDLAVLSTNKRHNLQSYETGISVTERKKTNRERLIIYPKFDELFNSRKNINKNLCRTQDPDQWRNVLRIESNFKHFEEMRSYFQSPYKNLQKVIGYTPVTSLDRQILRSFFKDHNRVSIVNDNKLHSVTKIEKQPIKFHDVFGSTKNVNYIRLNNMFNLAEIDTMKNELQHIITNDNKYSVKMKEISMRQIIAYYNYDINLIKHFLSSQIKGNYSRYLREYIHLMDIMKVESLQDGYKNISAFAENLRRAS